MMKFAVADTVTGKEIKMIRRRLGMTQSEFAGLVNVSSKTVERWEAEKKEITGPIVTILKILNEYPQIGEELMIPPRNYPLRLWYMAGNRVSTIIDVNEVEKRVRIYNYTKDNIARAFGVIEHPTYQDYELFLESRCFPRTRDKMKLILESLNLPFYDPFLIIEKTEGRMAEDDFWIRIER